MAGFPFTRTTLPDACRIPHLARRRRHQLRHVRARAKSGHSLADPPRRFPRRICRHQPPDAAFTGRTVHRPVVEKPPLPMRIPQHLERRNAGQPDLPPQTRRRLETRRPCPAGKTRHIRHWPQQGAETGAGAGFRYRNADGKRRNLPLPPNGRRLHPTECRSMRKNAGMGMRLRPNAKQRPARTLLRQRQLHPAALPPLPPGLGHRSFQNLGTGGTMEHLGKRRGQHPHRQTVGRRIYRSV